MPKFLFVYHGGGAPESEEEGKAMMARWFEWQKAQGGAVVEPGNPVGMSKTVSAAGVEDHGGANPVMGYSIVEADTIEQVAKMAQTCPHLEMKGATIEIAEIKPMPEMQQGGE